MVTERNIPGRRWGAKGVSVFPWSLRCFFVLSYVQAVIWGSTRFISGRYLRKSIGPPSSYIVPNWILHCSIQVFNSKPVLLDVCPTPWAQPSKPPNVHNLYFLFFIFWLEMIINYDHKIVNFFWTVTNVGIGSLNFRANCFEILYTTCFHFK